MLNSHTKNQGHSSVGNKEAFNKAAALLQKYFTQITRGCGDPNCSNPNCLSNVNRVTTVDPGDSNTAAVFASELLRTRAPLCSLLSTSENQVSPTPNQSVSSEPSALATAASAGPEPTDDNGSSAMDCLDIESRTHIKETEYLTEKRMLTIISECETKNDYSQLRRILGEVFYSADSVKKSFLFNHSTDAENDRILDFPRGPCPVKKSPSSCSAKNHCNNGGISLDLTQARSAFRALFDVPGVPFQQTLIEAIKYLMESTEVELKYRHAYEQDSDILNVFILVLEMPLLHEPEFIQQAFPAFCKAAAQLPDEGQVKLAKFLSSYTNSQVLNIVHAIQQSITVRLLSGNYGRHHPVQEDEAVSGATKLLRVLYYAALYGGQRDDDEHLGAEKNFYEAEDKILENLLRQDDFYNSEENGGSSSKEKAEPRIDLLGKGLGVRPIDARRPLIPFDEFYNETLSEVIEIDKDFLNYKADDGRFSFMHFPFILLPATKMQSMFFDNRIRMYSERRQALVQTLMGAPTNPYLRLRVRRSHLVEDSLTTLEIIAMDSPGDLKKQLYVDFEDEQGVDEGGVSKEFYQLITAELFNPDHGMFTYHPDSRLYWFNARCLDSAAEYTLIGTLFGLAIYNNIIVDVQFPMVVYKKLLGKLGTFEDLKDVDSTLYSSLKQILSYDGDDLDDAFACTFRIMCTDCYGEQFAHDLKPNGNDIPVTKENRLEFVKLYADYLLNRSIEPQFHAFRRGFCMVCTKESPLSWLFRPDEIEQLVCGSKSFDFMTLEHSTDYDNGYSAEHQTIKYFWEVIHEMSEEQKRLFLRFVTGSDRIPIGGMSKLKFIIARNGAESEKLPTAHTCFNVLLLPEYGSKEKLKERLLKAITYCEGFGLM